MANLINYYNIIILMEKNKETQTRAQINWRKVKDMLISKKKINPTKLHKFNLFHKQIIKHPTFQQIIYTHNQLYLKTYQRKQLQLSKNQIQSNNQNTIDSTGLWIWQTQQILAFYLIRNSHLYVSESIIQLGAGSSGLASLFALILFNPKKLHITDGKQTNLKVIEESLKLNEFKNEGIQVYKLDWADYENFEDKFQLILISDCLFFQKYHDSLLNTIDRLLAENGRVLLVNPSRGNSMKNFLSKTVDKFIYKFMNFEDELYLEWCKKIEMEKFYDPERDKYFIIQLIRKNEQKY